MPYQFALTEGESNSEIVTFDDIGFSEAVVLDWNVTNVSYSGDATEGQDFTVSSTLTEAGLRISVSAIDDNLVEATETVTATVSGYVEWAAPAGGNGEFYTNVSGDLVYGIATVENLSDTITLRIFDNDVEDDAMSWLSDMKTILEGLSGTLNDLQLRELNAHLEEISDPLKDFPFPDFDPNLPENVERLLRNNLDNALAALDLGQRVTDISTADNWHKELYQQSWDVVVGFDVTAGAALASGAALAALGIVGAPAIIIGGAVGVGASLIYTNYIQDSVRDAAGQHYDDLYGPQNMPLNFAEVLPSVLADAPKHVFEHAWYLQAHPEVRDAIEAGTYSTPFEHWLKEGIDLGYSPNSTGIVLERSDLAPEVQEYFELAGDDGLDRVLKSLGVAQVSQMSDLTDFAEDHLGTGTDGNDSVEDNAARIWLGAGEDVLTYLGRAQEIDMGPGRDEIVVREVGSLQDVVFDGGEGPADRLTIDAGAKAEVNLQHGEIRLFAADNTPLWTASAVGFELVNAGPGDDILDGGSENNYLGGSDGNDTLRGFEGNDTLDGGIGTDLLNGGDGDDQIIGGPDGHEADLRDVIYAGAGNDLAEGGGGNDQIFGQEGNDTLAGGFGADELQGQDGDDVITGGALSDLVFGGAGNDFVNGGFGYDRINGGDGADRFFHLGIADHGSDWVQDYDAAEGDVLVFGQTATADQFQINLAHTATPNGERSGNDDVQEAFVIYRPTGQIMWALVDGEGQESINIQIGGELFDLMT
ncbi:calcium-binding protein [Cribrihabitans sp. XS_ASV171]